MSKMVSNVLLNISYQILNMIIPLVTAPYISRVMTPNEIGIYSYSNSLSGFVAVFMLMGIANYGSRTIALNSDKEKTGLSKIFWELYAFQICTSCIGVTFFLLLIPFSTAEYRSALLAQIFYLLSVALDVSWYFTGTGQFKITVTRGCGIRILQTVAIFSFVKNADDLLAYILIMSIGTLLGNLLLWTIALRQISFTAVSARHVISHIKPNLVLFIPLLASSVFVYMDKVMLGSIASSVDLGLYEYAEKIVRIPITVISAIGAVMMPTISGYIARNDILRSRKIMDTSMTYISLLAAAMFFGILAIAPELAATYLGPSFGDCGELMQIMSIIIVFSSFGNILRTQYLIPHMQDKAYALSIVAGAMINLLLNGLLIPPLGCIGAAVGTVGAELMVLVGHLLSTRTELNLKQFFEQWGRALLCGFFMFLVIELAVSRISDDLLRLLLGIATGVVGFIIAALMLLRFQNDDILPILLRKKRTNDEQT